MICNEKHINPYCCEFCGSLICEKCYLEQFQEENIYISCFNCECNNFKEEKEINKINDENNYDNNNNNNENILEYNLKKESKYKIESFSKDFKKEVLQVVTKKFKEFTENASQNIYHQILEKYIENSKDINIQEAMKSKEELTEEATNLINKELKESSEEKFLTENSSSLYQKIVSIFQTKMLKKIDEFIDNLDRNENFINFVKECGIFDEKKSLEIEKEFNKYIKNLEEKEKESQDNAMKLQYRDIFGESGESSYGNSCESISSYSSK